jgi:two-component system, NarL family, invasion response regulator UvrY
MVFMRIMIVDDHEVVRLGFASLLRATSVYEVSAEASTVAQAYLQLQEAEFSRILPDVLVTDLNLEGVSGLELISKVRERFPGIKILALSMHENGALVQRALDLGAQGYFCKSSKPSGLKEAIEVIAAGRRFIDAVALNALQTYQDSKRVLDSLSRREFEVLRQMIKGENYLTIGKTLNLSVKTIANHLSSIRGKLGVETDFQLIRMVDSLGLPLL